MGTIRELHAPTGDKPLKWDPKNEKETEKARKKFDDLVGKGHRAYKVKQTTQRTGNPIKNFDPEAGEYVIVPPVSGG